MLCTQPELPANTSVSNWSAPWLSGFATDGFEKGVTRWSETAANNNLIAGLNTYFCDV
jgi:hypothetical protein